MALPDNIVLRTNIVQLANICRTAPQGYKGVISGQVDYPEGSFMFYGSIKVQGSDGNPINMTKEAAANWSVKFNQLPCDKHGNVLMTSHCFSEFIAPDSFAYMRLMVFCKSKPTHTVVLKSGELLDDNRFNDYLYEMIFSYTVLDREI